MNIKKLNISGFGKLFSKEVALEKGINILYAPNETGKSTLAAFIKFVLFGFSKKERASEKNPVTSKVKYIPWDNVQAHGSITFEFGDKTYTVQRVAKKTTQSFAAHNTLTGEQLAFTKEPGEELFGIGLETFESTAFFSQSAFAGLEMDELESKLRNIATGGDESVSYEKASSALKSLLNKIAGSRAGSRSKMNLINTQIEQLETKKLRLMSSIPSDSNIDDSQKEKRIEELNVLIEEKKAALQNTRAQAIQRQQSNINTLKTELEAKKEELFALEKSAGSLKKEQVNEATISYYRISGELSKYKEMPKAPKKKKAPLILLILGIALLIAGGVLVLTFLKTVGICTAFAGAAMLITGIALGTSANKKFKVESEAYSNDTLRYNELNETLKQIKSLLKEYNLPDTDVAEGLARLDNLVSERDNLSDAVKKAAEEISLKEARGQIEVHTAADTIENQLKDLEEEYNSLRIAIAEDKADLVKINSAKEELQRVNDTLSELRLKLSECSADAKTVELAINCLESAHAEMTLLFAPALNKAASEYLTRFGGVERTVTVDSKGNIKVCENGVFRPLGYYSAGTADLIYISVRLALIDLLYKDNKPVLVFDDTFANLDEERFKTMLNILNEYNAQVIFLTCRDPQRYLAGIRYKMIEF